jgi:hypothetical protein
MPSSYASIVIDADPEDVWRYVRNFDGAPGYVDLVETSEIADGRPADQVGCERVLLLQGDIVVREVLIGLDDERRELRYHLPESPFPFRNYHSTMRVHLVSESGGTFVTWSGRYDCDEADAKANDEMVAGGLYVPGLARLRDLFERRAE